MNITVINYEQYCHKNTGIGTGSIGIINTLLETLAMDRTGWRSTCKSAVDEFEVRRIQELEAKRDLRKSGPPSTSNFECQIFHRMCRSWIGLLAHNKSHSWWWDPSYRRLSPDFVVKVLLLALMIVFASIVNIPGG